MFRGLGIAQKNTSTFLFFAEISHGKGKTLGVSTSTDGSAFSPFAPRGTITVQPNGIENITRCSDFRISKLKTGFLLAYRFVWGKASRLAIATSRDCLKWKTIGSIPDVCGAGMIIPAIPSTKGFFLFYAHRGSIRFAAAKTVAAFVSANKKSNSYPILEPRPQGFDSGNLEFVDARMTDDGILVTYLSRQRHDHVEIPVETRTIGLALFSRTNPKKLLWRSDVPYWEEPYEWHKKSMSVLGLADIRRETFLYFLGPDGTISSVICSDRGEIMRAERNSTPLRLNRGLKNPILSPIGHHTWESKATFNPAALHELGTVHLLYRAIGESDVSVLGYAATRDGVTIDERLGKPAYIPRETFEGVQTPHTGTPSTLFMSGGGCWGGVEDPRLTKIGDRVYMTYVAYNGWQEPRIALTSIGLTDFLNRIWNWTRPVLISPPGVVNKNACILEETIDGKYVIFHRIFPNILIDYVDDLNFDGKTKWLKGTHKIRPRPSYWDSRKAGVGAPPLKTDKGWLLIYQAIGERDSGKYKIGAMLLDAKDPTIVIARSRRPILEPDVRYENEGLKSGVVYPCGAAVIDGTLFVYYGGADTVTCVATARLDDFLSRLLMDKEPHLGQATFKPLR